MSANFPPSLRFRVKDRSDSPAVGGKVYCYIAGTDDTPAETYKDVAGTIPNSHPIILDARGECELKLSPDIVYKIVVYDRTGNLIYSEPEVVGVLTNSEIIGSVTLQSAYNAGDIINTLEKELPVTITKGTDFQNNKIDSDGTIVQYFGQSSERRVSAREVTHSESSTDGFNGTGFHQEKLQKDYYSDEININAYGYESDRKHTETLSDFIDTDILKVFDVLRASDKITKDSFNFKREAFIQNQSNTNRIDILDQYSLDGHKENVTYSYNGQTNDDTSYQTIGNTNKFRTIVSGTDQNKHEDRQTSYSTEKKENITTSYAISTDEKRQFNNSLSESESVQLVSTGQFSKHRKNIYSSSISDIIETSSGGYNSNIADTIKAEHLLRAPDTSTAIDSIASDAEAKVTLTKYVDFANKDMVKLSTLTQNILTNGVIAEKAIGSTEQAAVDNGGSPRSLVCDCSSGQNFYYETIGTDPLGFSIIGTQSGFNYNIRINLIGGIPSSITWPVNSKFLGKEPSFTDENYIIKVLAGADGILYIADLTSHDPVKVAGIVSYPAPDITVDGSYNINMPEIIVNLWNDANYDGYIRTYTIPAITGLVTIDGGDQCIVADYNGGNPIYRILDESVEDWNNSTIIPVMDIWRVGTTIHSNSYDSIALGCPEKTTERIFHTEKYAREDGLGITESISPSTRTIVLTSGKVYSGVIELDISAFNSSINSLTRVNQDSLGNWVYSSDTSYNNTQYNSPTGLVTGGVSKWLVRWYYRSIGDEIDVFYTVGTAQYNSQALAEQALPDALLPNVLKKHCILVGRSVVQYNAVSGSTIPYFFETQATVSVEGSSVFTDNLFRVSDNIDSTKKIALQLSEVTTGTTRTLTVPDSDGTIALQSAFSGTGAYTNFTIVNGIITAAS